MTDECPIEWFIDWLTEWMNKWMKINECRNKITIFCRRQFHRLSNWRISRNRSCTEKFSAIWIGRRSDENVRVFRQRSLRKHWRYGRWAPTSDENAVQNNAVGATASIHCYECLASAAAAAALAYMHIKMSLYRGGADSQRGVPIAPIKQRFFFVGQL